MILLIDNNDSFTYNIVEMVRQVTNGSQILDVVKSHTLDIEDVAKYDKIIFSPGPSLPDDFPIMRQVLERYDNTKSILGICLGHQAICQYYGAKLENLDCVLHGVSSVVACVSSSLLFGSLRSVVVGRYHSWVAVDVPSCLRVTAVDQKGCVMAVEHVSKKVYGVQFHPESYITKEGKAILTNFIYGVAQ